MKARGKRRGARGVIIWGVIAFAAVQAAVAASADLLAPEIYDPEYAARLTRLQARRAEHPDRPLLLLFGSSRTGQLFRPEQLPEFTDAEDRTILAFNFSRNGGGPVYSRLAYMRLCQQGLKPEWAVIELMPALMTARYEHFFYTSITAGELRDLARYISGRRAVGCYAKLHVLPGYKNRTGLLRSLAPSWALSTGVEDPEANIDRLGGEGKRIRPSMPEADRRAEDARVSAGYAAILANYSIDPGADRALRDLLRACRDYGTRAVIIRTPESTTFRAGYRPQALATLDAYAADLTHEFGVKVVDARPWLPDEQFEDGHHPLLAGQRNFTERLYREVLMPLVRGESGGDTSARHR
jgi:hypothetical protein